jgi:hypothetical protein
MESHGILIYMAADNDLNPYGRLNDLKEIQGAQAAAGSWPLAVQFHSPGGGHREEEGILSIAFHQGHEIVRKQQRRGINTGDPKYFLSFLHWGHQVLQCQKYSLVIWGHGSGPIDAEKRENYCPKGVAFDAVAFDYSEDDALTTAELFKALSDFRKDNRFPVLGFDACHMASIEVMVELAPLCEIYVASEARVPDIGWPYQLILDELANNQPTNSLEMGQIICNHFMSLCSPKKPACISAVDTDKLSGVVDSMRRLVELLLKNISDPVIFLALYKAKANANLFGDMMKKDFVDLFSLVRNLVLYCPPSSPLIRAARQVGQKVKECVLANRSQGFDTAEGLAILFPYAPPPGIISRRYSQLSFCKETRWDEFLVAFHRGGQK